jgi:hypothetical protein
MKTTLLASVAILILGVSASIAAVPALDVSTAFAPSVQADMLQLARNGSDDSGSDDHGGNGGHHGGNGGHHGSSHDDNDNDDHGGRGRGSDDNSSNSSSDDDSPASGSNRRKPRVPGGSGCDGVGDAAEHAGC